MLFIREKFSFGFLHFFDDPSDLYIEKLNRTVSLNQHHIHLICGSRYPLKWTEPVKIQSCLVYRQKIKYCGRNRGRDPAGFASKFRQATKAEGSMLLMAG